MTISEVYQTAYDKNLDAQDQESRAFDLSCLLEDCFGLGRFGRARAGGQPADRACAERFFALCERYEAGEPLQYLLGEWEFYGLPFEVGEGVLIPRPDTETLVDLARSFLKGREAPAVADLCAGSGCIAVAAAHYFPSAQIYALELSEAALAYLRRNAARNRAENIRVLACDVLHPPKGLPRLDLILSNPPYIPGHEMESLQRQVQHEPQMALYGGEDGLHFYRAIPPLYLPLLKDGGMLAFEVGYNQARQVAALLTESGFVQVGTRKDLAGIDRVVFGYKKERR
ncbi:peptide chain release factor N(5)-glutamine methyltransferase [Anaerotruncus rubiinfantis]|uniref:peptide chain release factor N(5)-glutamine methyltransferase n=1 Tax=Anaerotruncus rubiinfantis TaxID=1720200 RepID=UPI00083200D7|nr:peptide chain release factor N(5)-glutamine methyltransferase [Anaerotruncus rubiinfantis]